MKIALGADHAGYELKDKIKQHLQQQGVQVQDEGTNSGESVDYPDYARSVGHDVSEQRADFGILVCGSGIGMAIAANKVPGIDRKSTRLNSSHQIISYAVFCLKKKRTL